MSLLSRRCRTSVPCNLEDIADPSAIRLDNNLCPYPPSKMVIDALKSIDINTLNTTPDYRNIELRTAIAQKHGVNIENVFVANGGDEALSMCFSAFFDEGDTIVTTDITNMNYDVWAHTYGLCVNKIELNKDFKVVAEDFMNINARGIVICNPNVPTSVAMGRLELLKIVENNADKIVIADEKYGEYANCSVLGFIKDYKNLVVTKTFSKAYALAGVRCGYAIASRELVHGLENIQRAIGTFPINNITSKLACAAIKDEKYLTANIDKTLKLREASADLLREMGFEVLPSSANFLFARHESKPASEIAFQLRERDVYVRHYKNNRISNFIRISVGLPENMDALIKNLKIVLK